MTPGRGTGGSSIDPFMSRCLGKVSSFELSALVPAHFLAGIGRGSAQDGRQRTFGHLLELVDRLARDDAFEQVHVLLDVGVDFVRDTDATLVPAAEAISATVPFAVGADDCLRDVAGAAGDLAAHGEHMHPVGVLIINREVVIALAALGLTIRDRLTAAHADGFDRVTAQCPAGHVEVVHMLFGDVITAQPEEMVPVADLVLGVAPSRLPFVRPDIAPIPVDSPLTMSPIAPS